MLPLSDGLPARRFPIVNISIIVANFAVWLFYELPHLRSSVFHASFYPCAVNNSCHGPESWGVSWITAMFLHGSWDHILGNMLFLAVFGAYFVLYPNSTVRGLVGIFPVKLSAWFFLGAWFLYQLIEANLGLFGATANGGGVAFFAHVGGFIFGAVDAWILVKVGQVGAQEAP